MSAVWVVRDAEGYPLGVGMWRWSAIDDADFGGDDLAMEELSGGSDGPFNGFTVTRETLCTPAQSAVIAAAKAYGEASSRVVAAANADKTLDAASAISASGIIEAELALITALNTLRAQEGES